MQKKRGEINVVILVIILIAILGTIYLVYTQRPYYTNNPKDWIERDGNSFEINVDKVTGGTGFSDEIGIQLRQPGISTVFDFEAYYKGNYFKKEYVNEGLVLMRVGENMNPNDGIIEGFMVETIENGDPLVYIFLVLDEDWKSSLEQTNIFWGLDYANEKTFSFNEIRSGIYMDVISDDPSRFSDNYKIHQWGIIVGDLTRDDSEDKTLIKLI